MRRRPTTVFTPIEYGAIGYSEEDAIAQFGEDNLEIYHSYFKPLEWTIAERDDNVCYAKLICDKRDSERVVGFHVLGPNAGEITQGFGTAMKYSPHPPTNVCAVCVCAVCVCAARRV
jgi:thioredoxin reductase (NADPH)